MLDCYLRKENDVGVYKVNQSVVLDETISVIVDETISLIEVNEVKEWIIQNKEYLLNYEMYVNCSGNLIPSICYPEEEKDSWLKDQYRIKRSQLLENIVETFSIKSKQTKCPYCGVEYSTYELDHYFPKSKYSIYSLFIPNLVPVCHYCNQKKSASNMIGETLYFHPYFHEINHRIFEYELLFDENQIIFADNKINVSGQLDSFLKRHVEKLGLLEKWKHHLANKLEEINIYIEELGMELTKNQLIVKKGIEIGNSGHLFPLVTFYEDVIECLKTA